MDLSSIIGLKEKISPAQAVGLIIGALLVWGAIAIVLAMGTHYPLIWFGCDWSNYWGWVVIWAFVPVYRAWGLGK